MQLPIQISFRNMDSSPAVEKRIRKEIEKLSEFYNQIMGCRVMAEIPHQHHQHGKRFHIRIDLTVPGRELVVNHKPSLHGVALLTRSEKHKKELEVAAPHKDIYVAIRDAFKAARRQLQDFARKQNGAVKHHEPTLHGRVSKLFPEEGYGFIETSEGAEIYIHRNGVLKGNFEKLTTGTVVSFIEEKGDKGPKASVVRVVRREHSANGG